MRELKCAKLPVSSGEFAYIEMRRPRDTRAARKKEEEEGTAGSVPPTGRFLLIMKSPDHPAAKAGHVDDRSELFYPVHSAGGLAHQETPTGHTNPPGPPKLHKAAVLPSQHAKPSINSEIESARV